MMRWREMLALERDVHIGSDTFIRWHRNKEKNAISFANKNDCLYPHPRSHMLQIECNTTDKCVLVFSRKDTFARRDTLWFSAESVDQILHHLVSSYVSLAITKKQKKRQILSMKLLRHNYLFCRTFKRENMLQVLLGLTRFCAKTPHIKER